VKRFLGFGLFYVLSKGSACRSGLKFKAGCGGFFEKTPLYFKLETSLKVILAGYIVVGCVVIVVVVGSERFEIENKAISTF